MVEAATERAGSEDLWEEAVAVRTKDVFEAPGFPEAEAADGNPVPK